MKPFLAFLKALWIWGLLTWLYVVADIHIFPEAQFWNLSVYVPIPTNLVGIVAFIVSFVAFVLWTWLNDD